MRLHLLGKCSPARKFHWRKRGSRETSVFMLRNLNQFKYKLLSFPVLTRKGVKCGFQISSVHMVINFHLTLGVELILNWCTGYTHYTHLVSSWKGSSQELTRLKLFFQHSVSRPLQPHARPLLQTSGNRFSRLGHIYTPWSIVGQSRTLSDVRSCPGPHRTTQVSEPSHSWVHRPSGLIPLPDVGFSKTGTKSHLKQ